MVYNTTRDIKIAAYLRGIGANSFSDRNELECALQSDAATSTDDFTERELPGAGNAYARSPGDRQDSKLCSGPALCDNQVTSTH